jgi:uncharacterized protein HemX
MASTGKSPAPAKPARPAKSAAAAKRKAATGGTTTGRVAIAILGGLALGLVAMAIYGISDSGSDWAFNRPDAKLPSLQAKHTLQ